MKVGQIWAGLSDGQPAVLRVQNAPDEAGVHVVALHSGMRGREATIPADAFGTRLRLVSEDWNPTMDQVNAWLEETRRRQVWVEANIERAQLREQAWDQHKDRLESEERRYQNDLDHIDAVYSVRTGETS